MDGQPATLDSGSTIEYLNLDVHTINSYKELDSFTNISVSATVKTNSYEGVLAYDSIEIYSMTADTAMVKIKAGADCGKWHLDNVKLKQEYQDIYDSYPIEIF